MRTKTRRAASKPCPMEELGNGGDGLSGSDGSSGGDSQGKVQTKKVQPEKKAQPKKRRAPTKNQTPAQTQQPQRKKRKALPSDSGSPDQETSDAAKVPSKKTPPSETKTSSEVKTKVTATTRGSRNEKHKNEVLIQIVNVCRSLSSLLHLQAGNDLVDLLQATAADTGLSDKQKADLMRITIKNARDLLREQGLKE